MENGVGREVIGSSALSEVSISYDEWADEMTLEASNRTSVGSISRFAQNTISSFELKAELSGNAVEQIRLI